LVGERVRAKAVAGGPVPQGAQFGLERQVIQMAKNPPTGDGQRRGQVTHRSQFKHNGTWFKRDVQTGQIMDGKADGKPFKGVRRERQPGLWAGAGCSRPRSLRRSRVAGASVPRPTRVPRESSGRRASRSPSRRRPCQDRKRRDQPP
jgi:hypothetical protein